MNPLHIKYKDIGYLFTDGACEPNPGPGAAAYVLITEICKIHLESKAFNKTTNNRMEMTSMILGFERAKNLGLKKLVVVSDSAYVIDGLGLWSKKWISFGWKRKTVDVMNTDLWKKLVALALMFEEVKLFWTKGHADCYYNNWADEMANAQQDFGPIERTHSGPLVVPAKFKYDIIHAHYDGKYAKPKPPKKKGYHAARPGMGQTSLLAM